MCLTLSRRSINVSPSLPTNGPHHGSNRSCCVNICPVSLAINRHPGALRGITEEPVCKGDWGFPILAETRVTPPSPSHNLRETSRCSQLASAGTTDPTFLKATNRCNTTKAYRLRKGTLQGQSEALQPRQPLPQTQGEEDTECALWLREAFLFAVKMPSGVRGTCTSIFLNSVVIPKSGFADMRIAAGSSGVTNS